MSLSFYNSNYYLHNGGDRLRHGLLFVLMFAPSGVVWAASAIRRSPGQRVLTYPWPQRILFVQLTLVYFFNGVYKIGGAEWRDGTILHYVTSDVGWSRWSLHAPLWVNRAGAADDRLELSFPLAVLWRPTRIAALCLGVLFHVETGLHLELCMFAPYALCFYLPLLPWERLQRA